VKRAKHPAVGFVGVAVAQRAWGQETALGRALLPLSSLALPARGGRHYGLLVF